MPCFRQEDESGIICRYEGTQFPNCARIPCPSTVPNDSTHCSYSIFLFSSNFRSSLVWFLLEKQFLIATLDHGVVWAEPLAGSPWSPQPRSSEITDQKTSLTIWFQTNLLQDVSESIRVRTEAAWGLTKSSSVSNMFGNWLNSIRKDCKPSVLVGAAAFCWSVWRCRNAVVFDNKKNSLLQVIFATTHWLRTWAILQWPSSQDILLAASHFWPRWPRNFLPECMGGSLVLGLTAISVLGFYQKLFCRIVCHYGKSR